MEPENREDAQGADVQPCCAGTPAESSCCGGKPAGDAGTGASCGCGTTTSSRCPWKTGAALLIVLAALALGLYALLSAPA